MKLDKESNPGFFLFFGGDGEGGWRGDRGVERENTVKLWTMLIKNANQGFFSYMTHCITLIQITLNHQDILANSNVTLLVYVTSKY